MPDFFPSSGLPRKWWRRATCRPPRSLPATARPTTPFWVRSRRVRCQPFATSWPPDHAGFLLSGAISKEFGQVDGLVPLVGRVKSSDWAVPLLPHTSRDNASVLRADRSGHGAPQTCKTWSRRPRNQARPACAPLTSRNGIGAGPSRSTRSTVGTAGVPGATTSVVLQASRSSMAELADRGPAGASVGDGPWRGALPAGQRCHRGRRLTAAPGDGHRFPAAGGGRSSDPSHALGPVGAS